MPLYIHVPYTQVQVSVLTLRGRAKAEAVSKTGQFKQSAASSSLIFICDNGSVRLNALLELAILYLN